uniref:ATP synthase subunit 9, mitochondrial n=4 Tax=Magnoliopsida TaxID=3398 RepID=A0A650GB85_RAPSA|nr:hypothetical protein [Raphanus sativus]
MRRNLNLLFSSSTNSAAENDILTGVPLRDILPNKSELDVISDPLYCSGTVSLPGDIVDPLIISNITRLNHFLVNQRYDFYGGIIQSPYIRDLQRELDQTPAKLLSDKLNFIYFRETLNLKTRVNEWYMQNLGVPGPANFLQEYEEKCYSNYVRVMEIPTPLEEWNLTFLFTITTIGIILLFFLFLGMRRKKNCKKCEKGMLEGAKSIGAGAATIASAGAAVGIGNVFSSLIHSVARNPSLAKQSFGYAILGFALTEAIALFAPMMAFLILFVF